MPAWPFVGLSFGLGVLALGPYFALWTPAADIQAPPRRSAMGGWRNLSLRITESRITAVVLLVATVVTLGQVRSQCPNPSHRCMQWHSCQHDDCSCVPITSKRQGLVLTCECWLLRKDLPGTTTCTELPWHARSGGCGARRGVGAVLPAV